MEDGRTGGRAHSCWRGTIALLLLLLSLSSDSVRCLTEEERRGGGRGQTGFVCVANRENGTDGRRGEERRGGGDERRERRRRIGRSFSRSVARMDGSKLE